MWGIRREDVYRELDLGWKSSRKIVEEIQKDKDKVRDPFVTGEILTELYNMRERGHVETRRKGIFRPRHEYRLTDYGLTFRKKYEEALEPNHTAVSQAPTQAAHKRSWSLFDSR